MTLIRPDGTILPCADATISISPRHAQVRARMNSRMIVAPIARPIGDGGVSTISRAAGRNASSSALLFGFLGSRTTFDWLADFMDTGLHPPERGIAPTRANKCVVRAVLDDTAAFDRHDA